MKATTMFIVRPWNPFREMEQLQDRMAAACGAGECRQAAEPQSAQPAWSPRAEVFETEKDYVVQIELPGVRKEDLALNVEDGVLAIRGKREFTEGESARYHRTERAYGPFERRFVVPQDADAVKIRAEFKDGVLRVRMEKDPAHGPKTVVVE